jgi:dTDP-glucose 4,6-dehydratase
MRLLVTGGLGFIGSNFLQYWLENHPRDTIVNLDAITYAADVRNHPGTGRERYSFYYGNICNPVIVEQAMEGCDAIVHFAAESHVDRSIANSAAFLNTNILGTHVLLEEARKRNVRFHHISTDEVFGALALGTTEKFNEQTPYDPHNPYSASKAASDHLVRSYYHTHGLPITITNASNNYGPRQHGEKFLPTVIRNALAGTPIPVYGDGLYVRDWLHVEDHVRAIEMVLERGRVGETYLVGGLTQDVPNLEIVRNVCEIIGADADALIKHVRDRPGHDRRYAVDWSKIHRDLGWAPARSLDAGLRSTIDWYRANPHRLVP